jgi:hypothetical protein
MNLDIHTAIQTATILSIIFVVISVIAGLRSIQKGRTLKFFRMRRDRIMAGWRMILFAFGFVVLAFLLNSVAEPAIYSFFPPTATLTMTPTVTVTPTITLSPTITLTPTITPTPSVSDTPTITPTPHIPLAVEAQFQSVVTPNPETVFSPLIFTQELDENWNPIAAGEVFTNPVGHMYALFSYDQMIPGSQWTAIWYYGGELVHFETTPWEGGTGGLGYTDWEPEPYEWLPGEYEVQIFLGLTFKISGRFTVAGAPPTAVPSQTLTPTRTQTPTPTVTLTRAPTDTPIPSDTRQPSETPTRTPTRGTIFPTATNTNAPTWTPAPPTVPPTHAPTYTSTPVLPTATHQPTNTPRPY